MILKLIHSVYHNPTVCRKQANDLADIMLAMESSDPEYLKVSEELIDTINSCVWLRVNKNYRALRTIIGLTNQNNMSVDDALIVA